MSRSRLPLLLLSTVGLLLVATSFVAPPDPERPSAVARFFAFVDRSFSVWFNILAVFAFILGAGSLLRSHLARIAARRRDWPFSVVTVVSFLAVLAIGLLKVGGPPGLQGDPAHPQAWLTWVFVWVYGPLKSTVYSLLAFFVASAAFRAFRLRSVESACLLGAGFVVLLGRTPFGVAATAWLPERLAFLRVDEMSAWLMRVPVTAGWRAILIGIALGVTAMSLRLILGLERHPFGGGRR